MVSTGARNVYMDGSESTEFLYETNNFYYLNARMHFQLHTFDPPFT